MIRYEDECFGCPPEVGCYGSGCPMRNVKHTYCDHCDADLEDDEIYQVDGEDLCEDCLKEMFRKG